MQPDSIVNIQLLCLTLSLIVISESFLMIMVIMNVGVCDVVLDNNIGNNDILCLHNLPVLTIARSSLACSYDTGCGFVLTTVYSLLMRREKETANLQVTNHSLLRREIECRPT